MAPSWSLSFHDCAVDQTATVLCFYNILKFGVSVLFVQVGVFLDQWHYSDGLPASSALWMALKYLLLKWKFSVGGEHWASPESSECRLLAWSGRHLLCGSQTQHSCIGRTKLKIEKAHPACKNFSCIYFSIYTFENGRQSSFPCFSPYSAFEACFRNSWNPTRVLALPPFLSPTFLCPFWVRYYIPRSSVSQTRDIVGKSCLKLAFPFPYFEISAFLWFLFFMLSCVVCLSYWLSVGLLWLPHLVSLQTVICRQSISLCQYLPAVFFMG